MDLRTVNSDELNGAGFPRAAGCFIVNLVWLTIPVGFKITRMVWSRFVGCNLQNLDTLEDRGVIFGEDYIFSAVAV